MKDKFAIIGAGFSGLAMANALRKNNIEFDIYDANSEIGGNWYNVVYNSGHTITPAKLMEFPDFKMPENFPLFPSKKQILAYLNDFVSKMKLGDHVHLNHKVQSIKNNSEEQWTILFENKNEVTYTGIILAIGLFREPIIPSYYCKSNSSSSENNAFSWITLCKSRRENESFTHPSCRLC